MFCPWNRTVFYLLDFFLFILVDFFHEMHFLFVCCYYILCCQRGESESHLSVSEDIFSQCHSFIPGPLTAPTVAWVRAPWKFTHPHRKGKFLFYVPKSNYCRTYHNINTRPQLPFWSRQSYSDPEHRLNSLSPDCCCYMNNLVEGYFKEHF